MSGPLPGFLAPITVPASWAYERFIEARNRKYDRGEDVNHLDLPVISVGNITTGGTGKTPMVMWIARFLREQGRHPAIALRGYGATNEHPSDEALEYAERLPDVSLLIDPDRVAAARRHLGEYPETDCIILDDGFQHRRLHRDLDLVLIDATRPALRDRLLPAGHLREPVRNLSRADAVIVTRAEMEVPDLYADIERLHGRPPIARTRHAWTELRIITADGESRAGPEWAAGKRLVTLLGIGNPAAVTEQIESFGASVAADIPAGDHERFGPSKLTVARGLCDGLDGLVMTGKDWARCADLIDTRAWPCPIIVPEVEIEFAAGEADFTRLLLGRIAAGTTQPGAAV